MTLDDVYGPEHDRFPLEQELAPAARMLDWNDVTDWCGGAWRHARAPRVVTARAIPKHSPLAVLLQAPRRAA